MLKRFGCSKTYSVSFKSNSHVHYFVSLLLILYQLWYKKPFYFSDFVVFQIVGGEIFPESKQDDDDPLQMGGDFTLNRLPDLLTNWHHHFWTKSLFRKCCFFPQVWSHHPQPQELEPVRPTNHPTNIGRCCCGNRTSTIVSINCSLDRESVRCYDGSRKNRMLQPDEYYWYWLSLGLRRKSFAIYWHWYYIDIGAAASLMIIIGRRWWQGW